MILCDNFNLVYEVIFYMKKRVIFFFKKKIDKESNSPFIHDGFIISLICDVHTSTSPWSKYKVAWDSKLWPFESRFESRAWRELTPFLTSTRSSRIGYF